MPRAWRRSPASGRALVVARRRAAQQLDERFLGAGDVEARFAAAKAQLRRDWRVAPWAQRLSYGAYMGR